MSTGDKIALVGLAVGVLGCVGTWLVVPLFQQWVNKRRWPIALGVALLAVSVILWLHSEGGGPREMQPRKDAPAGGGVVQTSHGDQSPNVISSGGGAVTVQTGTPAAKSGAKPKENKK
jgi:hypothetical protein